ncbi:Protein phosphatase 1 regulatory subunit 3B [Armadillidium nasatum]|uniref:Protein phosphatase 1 regulatory subunit 3B n=1 Tax=Armadillidium nasatum TaxID=96803 RepID=A0A5N5SYF4_9CRUS|nr:Protein phosphatase 1 regulatory subunit 3B [Armadillidium nasatum]
MPSDYGMEMLVGSSPILGSGFLGGSTFYSDYNRCAPMWNHTTPTSCLSDSVTTIAAKPINQSSFTLSSAFEDVSPPCDSERNTSQSFTRSGSTRRSNRSSCRRRKLGTVEIPIQLQQSLKSCLVNREETVPDGAVSPTKEKKKVSFADMTGGNLTHIKIITERPDCPPRWSQDFLEQSNLQLTGGAKAEAISSEWALTFSQPASDYLSWKSKLERGNVALENVVINESESLLSGTVKRQVHLTTSTTLLHFQYPFLAPSIADKIEFCICYETDGCQFWDNNNDKNYVVVSFKSKRGDGEGKPKDLYDIELKVFSFCLDL